MTASRLIIIFALGLPLVVLFKSKNFGTLFLTYLSGSVLTFIIMQFECMTNRSSEACSLEDLAPPNKRQSARAWKAWGALIAAGIVISLALFMRPAPTLERINVSITPIENQTENDEFGVLSKALSELLAAEIIRMERFILTPNEAANIILMEN